MSSELNQILNLIQSPELQAELLPAKIVFIIFSLAFFIAVVYLMFTSSYLYWEFIIDLTSFFNWRPIGAQKISRQWKRIQNRIETGTEYEYKLAIIEADDLFNNVLENRGFKAKTFEERIKQMDTAQLPNLDEIIEVHKIRNSIVYDPDYKIDRDQAKQFLGTYEKGIKNIEPF